MLVYKNTETIEYVKNYPVFKKLNNSISVPLSYVTYFASIGEQIKF